MRIFDICSSIFNHILMHIWMFAGIWWLTAPAWAHRSGESNDILDQITAAPFFVNSINSNQSFRPPHLIELLSSLAEYYTIITWSTFNSIESDEFKNKFVKYSASCYNEIYMAIWKKKWVMKHILLSILKFIHSLSCYEFLNIGRKAFV